MTLFADYSSISEIAECQRRAYYSQELELVPKHPSIALHAGSVLHSALYEYYASNRDVEAAVAAVHATWGGVIPPPDRPYLDAGHCEVIIRNYAEDRAREAFEPLKLKHADLNHSKIVQFDASTDDDDNVVFGETPIVVKMAPGLDYGMLIDLPAVAHGSIYVVDHKTTGQWITENWARKFARSFQVKGYARGLELATGLPVAGVYINGIYTGKEAADPKARWGLRKSRRNALFGPYVFSPHELDGVTDWAKEWLHRRARMKIRADLIQMAGKDPELAWPQNDKACDICPFTELCFAAPGMKAGIIARNFRTRPRSGILASGADTMEVA